MYTDAQNNKVHVEKDWFTSQVDDDDQSANEEPPIPPARKKVQTVTELDYNCFLQECINSDFTSTRHSA